MAGNKKNKRNRNSVRGSVRALPERQARSARPAPIEDKDDDADFENPAEKEKEGNFGFNSVQRYIDTNKSISMERTKDHGITQRHADAFTNDMRAVLKELGIEPPVGTDKDGTEVKGDWNFFDKHPNKDGFGVLNEQGKKYIEAIQEKMGVTVDGKWGKNTQAAVAKHMTEAAAKTAPASDATPPEPVTKTEPEPPAKPVEDIDRGPTFTSREEASRPFAPERQTKFGYAEPPPAENPAPAAEPVAKPAAKAPAPAPAK